MSAVVAEIKIIPAMHVSDYPVQSKSYLNVLLFLLLCEHYYYKIFVHRKFLISYDFYCIIEQNILHP